MPKGKRGFEPGKSGNPNGRKAGVPNRTTKEAREILDAIMFGQLENINDALNTLYEKDKARYIDSCSKLFNYVLPKKTDITSDGKEIPQLPIIQIKVNGD